MAQPTICLSSESRKSLVKHPLVRDAARKVAAANLLFPGDDGDALFGEYAGRAIEECHEALGICGDGPIADMMDMQDTILELAFARA